MALSDSVCIRLDDSSGKYIKTLLDPITGAHIQAVALVDDTGNQYVVFPVSFLAEHREGTLHFVNDYGAMVLALRAEDNRYYPLRLSSTHELLTSVVASALPAGAATAINQVTMITALQLIDDLRNALDSVATDELRTTEQETPPTDASKFNPSKALTYVAGDLTQIDITFGGTTYRKTYTYTNGNLTAESAWAEV